MIPEVNKPLRTLVKISNPKAQTSFYLKICYIMLPLFLFFLIAPNLLQFSRNFSSFKTYSFSIIALFSYFTLISFCKIFGESAILSPHLVFLPFFATLFIFFGNRYFSFSK